ncbi:MAG: hypothetical protein DRQ62_01570 [Gammaproteobacteria bacterium]|nr:MAG: hypothetical protein DRQ62_01570 [Gammaproteobacteria bacterium]
MSELKVKDTTAVKEEPKVAVKEVSKAAPKANPLSMAERVPSNWKIVDDPKGIAASNYKTGRMFTGTREEFNNLLRG